MKVLNFSVRNVMKISEVDFDMNGKNLVLVGGKNGNGKSSCLTALAMALRGKRAMGKDWPDVALKEGEDEGSVEISLSGNDEMQDEHGFTLELGLKRKRGGVVVDSFVMKDSTGEEAPSPRELMNSLYRVAGFDPLEFERASKKEQAQMVRDLVGLDFTALDEERKKVYAERTKVNAEGKALKAVVEKIEVPAGTPDDEVDVSQLMSQLDAARSANDGVQKEIERTRTLAVRADDKHDSVLAEIKSTEAKIASLKERLASLVEQEKTVSEEQAMASSEYKKAQEANLIDEEPIREQISNAAEINKAVNAKRQYKEKSAELDVLRSRSNAMTDRIKEIDKKKETALTNAEWPVEGMGIDEDGVLMNGLPFEQASKAERIKASAKVLMGMNPTLRLMICQDGNDLDLESLAELESLLVENDYQMLLEFVTRGQEDEDRCAIVFQDGTPKE